MKLGRLVSETAFTAREGLAVHVPSATLALHPVAGGEGLGGDRERSLQEEMAAIEALAIGEFSGEDKAREAAQEDAHAVAAQIAGLGEQAGKLLSPQGLATHWNALDDQA